MLTSTEALNVNEVSADVSNQPRKARLLQTIAPTETRKERMIGMLIAVCVAAFYLFVLLCYFAPANGDVDQNGYLVGGRKYLESWSTGYKPANDFAFVGNMWVRADDGTNFPKYPVGLSMLYAASLKLFGAGDGTASMYAAQDFGVLGVYYTFMISPICGALAVLGTYFIARNMMGVYASIAAMLLYGFSQTVLMLGNNPNSHMSCLAFVVWGMALLISHWRTGSIWRGVLSGVLLGFAMTIRYTEGLLALPIAIVAISMIRCRTIEWIRLIPLLLLGVISIFYIAILPVLPLQLLVDSAKLSNYSFWVFAAVLPLLAVLCYRVREYYRFGYQWSAGDLITTTISLIVLLCPLLMIPFGVNPLFAMMSSSVASTVLLMGMSTMFAVLIFINDFRAWRGWLVAAMPTLGWLIPVGYLIGFNKHFMGTWTGYDTTKESSFGSAFTWEHVLQNWERVLRQMNGAGMFFVLPVGVLGLLILFRRSRLLGTVMLAWMLPCVAIYTAYYWAPEWGSVSYLRFFVTVFPAICVGAAYVFSELRKPMIESASRALTLPYLATAFIGLAMIGVVVCGRWMLSGYTYERTLLCTLPIGLIAIAAMWARRKSASLPLAMGLFVSLSAGVGTYRAVYGIEGGVETGQSMEVNFRNNSNLGGLGAVLAEKAPANSVVFAMTRELHFFQYLKNYECYRADAFRSAMRDEINRSLSRTDDGNADPLQPSRFQFLQRIYKDKSDKDLVVIQNDIMNSAFAEGRRVFAVLEAEVVTEFVRKFCRDKTKFSYKVVGYYNDMPKVIDYSDLPDADKRVQSTNPRRNWNNRPRIMGERGLQRYQIIEITPAPAPVPAPVPATAPTTAPTTAPATKPAMPTTKPRIPETTEARRRVC